MLIVLTIEENLGRLHRVISEPKIRISSRLSTPRYGRICLWRKPDIEQPLNDYA